MAEDLKISELPLRSTVLLTDQFPVIAGGVNYKVRLEALEPLLSPGETVIEVPGTSYTLTASDDNTLLNFTNQNDVSVLVPTGLPSSFRCRLLQNGSGRVVVVPSGTTIISDNNYRASAKQYVVLELIALYQNILLLTGALAPLLVSEVELPVNTGLPTITVDGFKLTSDVGIWINDVLEFAQQWIRDTEPIEGAEGEIYNLVEEDIGKLIRVVITATNDIGDATATSLPYGPVAGSTPVFTSVPTITGGSSPPKVGETLSGHAGALTGTPTPALALQWLNNGVTISGADGPTYRVDFTDLGDTISLRVTATNIVGSATSTSIATGAVVAGSDTTAPTLSALVVTPNGEQAAFLSVQTNEGDGTFYWTIQADGLPAPTAANVQAGQTGAGVSATSSGSFRVETVETWGPNPTGLSAGTVYDAYAVMYDSAGLASNVVTTTFTTAGGTLPVLNAEFVVDRADVFVMARINTNNGNGTLYGVVVPATDTAPSAAQIKAGTNSANVAAPSANQAMTTPGTKNLFIKGLIANTLYRVYLVQHITAGDSNVVNINFMTDVLVWQFFNGSTALTGITSGSAPFVLSQPDPYGGTNAVRWNDSGATPLASGIVSMYCVVNPFFKGNNRYHFMEKWQGGGEWQRFYPANINHGGGTVHANVKTGTLGSVATVVSNIQIFDMSPNGPAAAGWFMHSCVMNHDKTDPNDTTLVDLNGLLNFYLSDKNNSANVTYLDGSHHRDVFNFRITRAS